MDELNIRLNLLYFQAVPPECCRPVNLKDSSFTRTSLGCLGVSQLSRTYENLSDLSEAVESLRHELTGGKPSFLHSVPPSYSSDNLDAVYHIPLGQSFNLKKNPLTVTTSTVRDTSIEPIYQNVGSLMMNLENTTRKVKSASELDSDLTNLEHLKDATNVFQPSASEFVTDQKGFSQMTYISPNNTQNNSKQLLSPSINRTKIHSSVKRQRKMNQRLTAAPLSSVQLTGSLSGDRMQPLPKQETTSSIRPVDGSGVVIIHSRNEQDRGGLSLATVSGTISSELSCSSLNRRATGEMVKQDSNVSLSSSNFVRTPSKHNDPKVVYSKIFSD